VRHINTVRRLAAVINIRWRCRGAGSTIDGMGATPDVGALARPARTTKNRLPDGGATGGVAAVPEPALTVAAVARRLGVAPATLRTWDRRYGLGPSEHTAGAHRRYGPADLARLGLMRRLTLQGVPPAEAARVARDAGPEQLTAPAAGARALPLGAGRSASPDSDSEVPTGVVAAPPVRVDGMALAAEPVPSSPLGRPNGPHGGGRVLAMPNASAAARGLARASSALDASSCSEILVAHLDRHGLLDTWRDLLVPVLRSVGERWDSTGQGVEVEHLLSECVMGALRLHVSRQPAPAAPGQVLLACAEEEQHALPLHALAAGLAEAGLGSLLLGARVPREALAAAVRRCGPAVVFVWSQGATTASVAQLRRLPSLRPAPRVLLGGPGWRDDEVPRGVRLVRSLDEAITEVRHAAAV
jgi:DNA-binding transcriptional MerR regulator